MPHQLDLAQLHEHELRRILPVDGIEELIQTLTQTRLAGQSALAPDIYPDALELRIAEESDWDALGASIQHALQTKTMRDQLHSMDFRQVGAFRLLGLPYPRNFFAYVKEADTFGALYLSDREGPAPYLELFTLHRPNSDAAKAGKLGLVTSSAPSVEALDPSPSLTWLPDPGVSCEALFQLHRNRLMGIGKANRRAATVEDFTNAYLEVWNLNLAAWRERGVLKAVAVAP